MQNIEYIQHFSWTSLENDSISQLLDMTHATSCARRPLAESKENVGKFAVVFVATKKDLSDHSVNKIRTETMNKCSVTVVEV